MASSAKPRLVFFQADHLSAPEFGQAHMRQHVKCLAENFDVHVVQGGGDYEEVCERFEPDLVLFEGGGTFHSSRRPPITNTSACASIPRLGLHNSDPWCDGRAGFLSDMDHWGVETFFSISTTMAEHTPDVADRLFVWPNFIDAELYRDYGESKIIPILITGSVTPLYPWRQRVRDIIPSHYPSLICPHFGYTKESTARMMHGERYARTLNASYCVPTCGTVANEFLRKHLEIPAARSCLITERSQVLEAAGFVDMTNCVFADADDVLDKLDRLFANPDELKQITDAGHHLVHSRHTLKQRGQIRQWFDLHRSLESGHRIVQTNPFEPLSSVSIAPSSVTVHLSGNGLHIEALAQGDEKLQAGAFGDAESLYRRALNYIHWMPEPKVRLAICALHRGDAGAAAEWLRKPLEYTLNEYGAADPDPVEWAYMLISLLCAGDVVGASCYAAQFSHLRHPELDRVRWAVRALGSEPMAAPAELTDERHRRRSVHKLPFRSFEEWTRDLSVMLNACRQPRFADAIRSAVTGRSSALQSGKQAGGQCRLNEGDVPVDQPANHRLSSLPLPKDDPGIGRVLRRLVAPIRMGAAAMVERLNRVERRLGYFLPYRYSAIREDEFVTTLRSLVSENRVNTAMVLGASAGVLGTEAVLSFRREWDRPMLYFVNGRTSGFRRLARICADDPLVECQALEFNSRQHSPGRQALNLSNGSGGIDLLLIDESMTPADVRIDEVAGPRFVVVDHINQPRNFEVHQRLLSKPEYELITQNLTLRNGYSVFRRTAPEPLRG